MFLNAKHTAAVCFATCMSLSASAIADIVISGTRVIYKSNEKSVNVRLENKGNNPLLVQSWLDTGDDSAEPGSITVPFTATPPVSRIDAKRGQTIKLMYTASPHRCQKTEKVFSGLTYSRFHPNLTQIKSPTRVFCNWHSVRVSNYFIARKV